MNIRVQKCRFPVVFWLCFVFSLSESKDGSMKRFDLSAPQTDRLSFCIC
jgi:hypothetical protein